MESKTSPLLTESSDRPAKPALAEVIGLENLNSVIQSLTDISGNTVAIHETDGTCIVKSTNTDGATQPITAAVQAASLVSWSDMVVSAITARSPQHHVGLPNGLSLYANPIMFDDVTVGCVSVAYCNAQTGGRPLDELVHGVANLTASLISETYRRRCLEPAMASPASGQDLHRQITPVVPFPADMRGPTLDASSIGGALGSSNEASDLFRCLFENSPYGQIVADAASSDLLVANRKASEILGHSPEEFIKLKLGDLSTSPKLTEEFDRSEEDATSRSIRFSCEFRHKDGSEIATETEIRHEQWIGRHVVVTTILNEPESNTAAPTTRAYERLHAQIFELTTAIKILVEPDTGLIIDANNAAAQFYGYQREDMRNRTVFDLFTEPRTDLLQELQRTKSGQRSGQHFRHRLASGEERDVEISSGPAVFDGRTILFMIVTDITDRLIAERSLRESEWRLAEAQRMAHLGSWHGNIVTGKRVWSDEQFRICGYDPGAFEPTFERVIDITHPDDRKMVADRLRYAWQNSTKLEVRHRIIRPNGEIRHIHSRGTISPDANGRPTYIMGTTLDITELTELELELRRAIDAAEAASAAKSQFLANMSHELRTPLNSVIGFAELMKARIKGPLPDAYAEYADLIHLSGRRLLETINLVLDLSKIEAGKFALDIDSVLIAELVDEVVTLMHVQADAKGLELISEIESDGERRIDIDPVRVKQVLMNIIGNAVKFTESGRVTVTYRRQEGQHAIIVSDTGIGMTETEVGVALKPFEQVHRDVFSRRMQGTGLGLSLSKRIMELHGGTLEIVSMPGRGTNVMLGFPTVPVTPSQ